MTVTTPTDTRLHWSRRVAVQVHRPRRPPRFLDQPRVVEEVLRWSAEEFGNASSRTHEYGRVAKARVSAAREEVSSVVGAQPDEVTFTSGATESNNLAILGLAAYGRRVGRRHIITTEIEHKAVLEPIEHLSTDGFEVTRLQPEPGGWVDPQQLAESLRTDTLLVSIMAVNNETGVVQPLSECAEVLSNHDAYMHVDAAQGFGKTIDMLKNPRIDLQSVSAHKIYGPKGVGALIARRRRFSRPPLEPLMFGGSQEKGLRPGTLPVSLIAGLGTASSMAVSDAAKRQERCLRIREFALAHLESIGVVFNGSVDRTVAHTLNFSLPGVDSEAAIVALKGVAAVSNGSACTSQSYSPSHVLMAAGLPNTQIEGALRFSWSHMTDDIDWSGIAAALSLLRK